MEFHNTTPVVNVEARNGSVYLHDEVAETYLDLAGQLDKISLSAPESLAMLRSILEEV
jgi:sRNA-binding carbon storage regulator CsrA